MRVIKDTEIIEDDWQLITDPGETSIKKDEDVIVPYKYWSANRDQFSAHTGQLSICVEGDDMIEDIVDELGSFSMIVLSFPLFKDGRCYSHARLLRERYGYEGEIRAVGEVLRDQLFYMQRCGINAYHLTEDSDYEQALHSLSGFSLAYQGAADDTAPISKTR